MLETLTGLPEGLIGFEVVGEIEASDYTDTLKPVVAKAAESGKVRLVYVIGDRYTGMTGGAFWEDSKFGVTNLHTFERTALVTDVEWMTHIVALLGWMVPGGFKLFPLADLDRAIAWAASDD